MPRIVSQPDRRFESGSTIRHNSRVETCTQRKPMIDFSGKVALITGATSGIGEATAVMFARYSARVVIAGRRDAEGECVVESIKAAGEDAIFVHTDVQVEAEVENLVKGKSVD